MYRDPDKEIQTTRNWGLAILTAILVPSVGFFVWIGDINSRVEQNASAIKEIKTDVQGIDNDIRAILVGIEQVKARLGIIEKE